MSVDIAIAEYTSSPFIIDTSVILVIILVIILLLCFDFFLESLIFFSDFVIG